MLMFNAKLSAQQAFTCGLVTQIFPDQTFAEETKKRIKAYAQLPTKVCDLNAPCASVKFISAKLFFNLLISQCFLQLLISIKGLVRGWDSEVLHSVNEAWCNLIAERLRSEDFRDTVFKYFSRKHA